MMKIECGRDGDVATLRFSGQISEDHLAAIQAAVRQFCPRLVFDLAAVTLVDRAVVQFLAKSEGDGVEVVNCPRYIRQWIGGEVGE